MKELLENYHEKIFGKRIKLEIKYPHYKCNAVWFGRGLMENQTGVSVDGDPKHIVWEPSKPVGITLFQRIKAAYYVLKGDAAAVWWF